MREAQEKKKAAEYITNEMRKIGLCNISKHAFEVDAWEYRKSTLTYLKCGERISYPLSAFANKRDGKRRNQCKYR